MKVCFRFEFVAVLHLTRIAVYGVHANKKGLYFACFVSGRVSREL